MREESRSEMRWEWEQRTGGVRTGKQQMGLSLATRGAEVELTLSSRGRRRPMEVSCRPGPATALETTGPGHRPPAGAQLPVPSSSERPIRLSRPHVPCESRLRSEALGGARASAFPEAAVPGTRT